MRGALIGDGSLNVLLGDGCRIGFGILGVGVLMLMKIVVMQISFFLRLIYLLFVRHLRT